MKLRHTALALAMLAGLAACGSGAAAPPAGSDLALSETSAAPTEFTLTGTFELSKTDETCVGDGGYDDIAAGAAITVYDDAGKIVAVGKIGKGVFTQSATGKRVSVMTGSCTYPVEVEAVPVGPKFYQVEISHRGKITISAEDAQAGLFGASLG